MNLLLTGLAVLIALAAILLLLVLVIGFFAGRRRAREPDVPPHEAQLQGFTVDEIARLSGVQLWVLWYEDRFDPRSGDSFGIAVHLSEASAQAALAATGRPLHSGGDGYTVEGPADALQTVLLGKHRESVLRQVLSRLDSGSAEPVPLPID